MKYILVILILFTGLFVLGQNSNQLDLVLDLKQIDDQSSYQLMYKRKINTSITLRGGLSLFIDTDKEIRNDSLSLQSGTVTYDISAGFQRDLKLEGFDHIKLYFGMDGYWNSTLNRKPYETYYGYYWNIGLKPLVGFYYDPIENLRLSVESRANLNFNFQQYSAPGENIDQRLDFRSLDQLAFGIGYLF
tara:strand:- start:96 stop:662 length:567 start_codon:yes stop_codon:yes gene_type:complete